MRLTCSPPALSVRAASELSCLQRERERRGKERIRSCWTRRKKSFTNFAEEVKGATNSDCTSPHRKLWKVRLYVPPCRGLLLVVLNLFLGLLECADTEH